MHMPYLNLIRRIIARMTINSSPRPTTKPIIKPEKQEN
jgi:hypothetical protein